MGATTISMSTMTDTPSAPMQLPSEMFPTEPFRRPAPRHAAMAKSAQEKVEDASG